MHAAPLKSTSFVGDAMFNNGKSNSQPSSLAKMVTPDFHNRQ
jgi:hypothetical protein